MIFPEEVDPLGYFLGCKVLLLVQEGVNVTSELQCSILLDLFVCGLVLKMLFTFFDVL